jgi:hypothetical protein
MVSPTSISSRKKGNFRGSWGVDEVLALGLEHRRPIPGGVAGFPAEVVRGNAAGYRQKTSIPHAVKKWAFYI